MVFARDETNATEGGYGLETELADPDPNVIDAAADAAIAPARKVVRAAADALRGIADRLRERRGAGGEGDDA